MRWLFLALAALAFSFDAVCSLAQTIVAEPPKATSTEQIKVAGSEKTQQSGKSEDLYLRVLKSDGGAPKALQTSIVRYRGKKGTPHENKIVDLVGVVHIGQREYYLDLNDRLSKYDSVLYELVAPDGTRIRPADLKKRRSLLASMQTGMKDMLNLEYQLELIDYMAKNFRHADMSPEEFSEDLTRRGDSIWKMAARMMGAGLASSAATGGDTGMLLALFSSDRAKMMKRTMAQQLVDIDSVTAGMDDENGENTLIKGRNAKAFGILEEELQAGKKKVAVFYGAGHLPDMAERLEKDFGMQFKRVTWMDAWDLTSN